MFEVIFTKIAKVTFLRYRWRIEDSVVSDKIRLNQHTFSYAFENSVSEIYTTGMSQKSI